MKLLIFSLLLCGLVLSSFSQENLKERREKIMKLFKIDPLAARDSMRLIIETERKMEAQRRMARYINNQRQDTLTVIDLSYAGLDHVPDFVLNAHHLQKLVLSNNNINKLPDGMQELDSLKTILWNNSSFDTRPSIPKLPQVKKFYFNSNQLSWRKRFFLFGKKIPLLPRLQRFERLELLELSDNNLKECPVRPIARLERIDKLILNQNPISSKNQKWEKLMGLKELSINNADIDSFDPDIYKIRTLTELLLMENKINEIPEGISGLKNLEKLSFYKNKIEILPPDFFDLPELLAVDLYYNNIEKLPPSIKNAEKLEVLFISHNRLYDVPEELGEIENLEELYLHNNRISYLPEQLSKLNNLKILRINDNYLTYFPEFILSLNQLRDLDLNNNSIEKIPPRIGEMDLKLFTFEYNNIDFESEGNKEFLQAVYNLSEKGAVCKPAIKLEYVDEKDNVIDIND